MKTVETQGKPTQKVGQTCVKNTKRTDYGQIPKDYKENLKILVAEDNPTNQLIIKRFFKLLGFHCTLAVNGKVAQERMAKDKFDVALVDYHMPELNGAQLVEWIRTEYTDPSMLVVALTASNVEEDHQRLMEAGMDDVLEKPLKISHLKELVLWHYRFSMSAMS